MGDMASLADVDDGQTLAQSIVDTIREPLLVLDNDLRVTAASRAFYLTFKVERQHVQGRPLQALGDGQWNLPELESALRGVLSHSSVVDAFEVEAEFPGHGRRNMLLNARRVFSGEKASALILLSIDDITERRRIEQKTAELLQQKDMLLLEMQHRVANSLQIIAGILSLKARSVESEEIRLHLQDAHHRVLSVATVQRQLQEARNLERIAVGPYLSRLCEALGSSMIGDTRPITVSCHADDGTATSSEAVSMGLIVTELVINALKHAFVDGRAAGRIDVSYESNASFWKLSVADDGVGQPPGHKVTPGLGTSIVEALSKQLEARADVRMAPGGTTVSITRMAST